MYGRHMKRPRPSDGRPRSIEREIASIEFRLDSRRKWEKGLFDDRPLTTIAMLFLVAVIVTFELITNVMQARGWAATAHLAIMTPLGIVLMYLLALGTRSLAWRRRLRRLTKRPAPAGNRTRAASSHST